MRYSFSKDEKDWLCITVANPSNIEKGIAPTEAENILNRLQRELFGENSQIQYKLNIEIHPKLSRMLDDKVIDFIKIQESRYKCNKRGKNHYNYNYYALTLYALQKLGYVDENRMLVNQTTLSKAFGLRRASLCSHYSILDHVEDDIIYLEIERNLFNLE